eukprot:scaffold191_cov677-Pavlova_lutheri.AAC.30
MTASPTSPMSACAPISFRLVSAPLEAALVSTTCSSCVGPTDPSPPGWRRWRVSKVSIPPMRGDLPGSNPGEIRIEPGLLQQRPRFDPSVRGPSSWVPAHREVP